MEKLKFKLKESMLESKYFTKLKKIYGEDEARKQLDILCSLSKHKLECFPSIINWIKWNKFSTKHGRLLGTKSKAMPDNIFKKLLNACDNERIKLLIEYDGFEGPRPHSAVQLKTSDLNFEEHTVTIHNFKENRFYTLPLNKQVETHLREFIKNHHEEIKEHDNYIFFSLNPKQKRNFLSDRYVKNFIVSKLKELGLQKEYAISKDGRHLYLYGFHSIRGHAITQAYEKSNHNVKMAQKVADHSPKSVDITMLYISSLDEELANII